jgi:pentatricopeptide repeat protein
LPPAHPQRRRPPPRDAEPRRRRRGADSLVYNNLIASYIDLDDWDKAFKLFKELTSAVYDGVVHTTFMEGYWKRARTRRPWTTTSLPVPAPTPMGLQDDADHLQCPAPDALQLSTTSKSRPATCGSHDGQQDNHTSLSFIGINAESYNVMVN